MIKLFALVLLILNSLTASSKTLYSSIYFKLKGDTIPQKNIGNVSYSNRENKIIRKILSIPEVKEKNKFIDSLSKHKHGISVIVLKRPIKATDYYWVQAGYNNEIRFEPYYNFYVYGPEMVIKFFDPMTNEVYSLREWRRKGKIIKDK